MGGANSVHLASARAKTLFLAGTIPQSSFCSRDLLDDVTGLGAEMRFCSHPQGEILPDSPRTRTASCGPHSRSVFRLPADRWAARRLAATASSSTDPVPALARSPRSDARSLPGLTRPPSSRILPHSSPVCGPVPAAPDYPANRETTNWTDSSVPARIRGFVVGTNYRFRDAAQLAQFDRFRRQFQPMRTKAPKNLVLYSVGLEGLVVEHVKIRCFGHEASNPRA